MTLSARRKDSISQWTLISLPDEMTLSARGAGPLWQKKQRSLPVERVFSDRWNDFHCQAIFLHHRTEKWLTEYHIWNIDMIVQYTVCIWVLYLQWDFAWTSFDQLLYWQQFDAKFLHIELRTYDIQAQIFSQVGHPFSHCLPHPT